MSKNNEGEVEEFSVTPEEYTETSEKTEQKPAPKVIPTKLFNQMLHNCLGKLPYSSTTSDGNGGQLKVIDLLRFFEGHMEDGLSVDEMNAFITYIANLPLDVVRPLMEIVENSNRHNELWLIK